jgi:uncharacterized protein with ParB-like and HNH nuclease domain
MAKTTFSLYTIRDLSSMMESGKLVVPAFQRGFVWSSAQVRNLIESIYHGYPIGTIIVLEDEIKRFKSLPLQASAFPKPERPKDSLSQCWFVIDGSQRLAALYNCFFATDRVVNFSFDLENEEFVQASKIRELGSYIDLHSLYSPEQFLLFQKTLFLSGSDEVFYRVKRLYEIFNDYQLPVQVVREVSDDDAVSIFQAVNTTGKRLSKIDIETAKRRNT